MENRNWGLLLGLGLLLVSGLESHAAAEVVADPYRFDEAIAAFEEADRKAKPVLGQVLFLGSSSIRRLRAKRG